MIYHMAYIFDKRIVLRKARSIKQWTFPSLIRQDYSRYFVLITANSEWLPQSGKVYTFLMSSDTQLACHVPNSFTE